MKKIVLSLAVISGLATVSTTYAEGTTSQSVATWSATAKKDTTSKLVVTPLGSLTFNYAQGIKSFNSQKGLFDVTVEGDTTATAFKLTSKLSSNTLSQAGSSGSTLNVGVSYNGLAVSKATETVMIDTSAGILGGNLSALSNAYNKAGRTSAQDQFTFTIIGATSDGTTTVTDFSTLPEGVWSGDVSVEFNATWTA
jgi:hypothetical protein